VFSTVAGWISSRLNIPATVENTGGPGISAAELRTSGDDGESYIVRIERPDGRSATLSRGGEQPRALPLPRRELGDLLAEELRRMDADVVYAEALSTTTGIEVGMTQRARTLVWRDPARVAPAS
jgi:glucose-6-phosphate dehydrogenase assembly protein OpcA